eukprot:scaffold312_cov256-Pinguiococcus_pyrenoidosus.AAC.12
MNYARTPTALHFHRRLKLSADPPDQTCTSVSIRKPDRFATPPVSEAPRPASYLRPASAPAGAEAASSGTCSLAALQPPAPGEDYHGEKFDDAGCCGLASAAECSGVHMRSAKGALPARPAKLNLLANATFLRPKPSGAPLRMSTGEENVAEAVSVPDIPKELPSGAGYDHLPLAQALREQDFQKADQITRDSLIALAGEKARERQYVYWTEVKDIPNEDMATMERLWLLFSDGKFGYTVQKKIWRLQKGDFEQFCRKIGWNTKDGEIERKLKWFGVSEFIYDKEKAPRGHLPLTAALRGTPLLKELLHHPVWDTDFNPDAKEPSK